MHLRSCGYRRPANGEVQTSRRIDDLLSLHIGIEYGRGGAGRVFSELMQHLPAAGFRFQGLVGAPGDAGKQTDGVVESFAPTGAGLRTRLIGARHGIRDAIKLKHPDVIASHFALYSAPALDLLRGQRTVSHFHGPWSRESMEEGNSSLAVAFKSRVEGTVYRSADRVIVLSKAFGELVTNSFKVDPSRVRLVPGSVDTERFAHTGSREDSRRLLGFPLDRPILVSVRRLVHRMGLSTLIDAMPAIVAAMPEVLLVIGGQGPLRDALEAKVANSGLGRNVQFLGFIEETALPHVYAAADINLVPTRALEGFGLVAAEAMAAGTPSMVTPIGGLPEVVSPLAQNLVFASCSAEDIAAGIIGALRGNLRLPGAEQCRQYIQDNFSSSLMAERTAAVYNELL